MIVDRRKAAEPIHDARWAVATGKPVRRSSWPTGSVIQAGNMRHRADGYGLPSDDWLATDWEIVPDEPGVMALSWGNALWAQDCAEVVSLLEEFYNRIIFDEPLRGRIADVLRKMRRQQ
jgi:hypothetical protein